MTPLRANAVALLAALAWGLGNVSQKTILDHLDGYAAAGLTSIIGALVLLPLARHEARLRLPSPAGSWPLLALVAALFTLAATLMQFGYGQTSVTNAGFLVNTAAVITPVLAITFFRQNPPVMIWVASLITLAGVFNMAGGRWTGVSQGDALCLMAAVAFAVWTLYVGQYVMRYRRPILMTVVQLMVCGVICVALGAAIYGPPSPAALLAAWPEIVFMGLVSKGLAYVLMAVAQQHLSATSVAVLVSAESVFGAMAAMVLLGEGLNATRAVGALCILLGVIIAASLPVKLEAAPQKA
jgi:drug/metabolite transporter (DMT)-like permease